MPSAKNTDPWNLVVPITSCIRGERKQQQENQAQMSSVCWKEAGEKRREVFHGDTAV